VKPTKTPDELRAEAAYLEWMLKRTKSRDRIKRAEKRLLMIYALLAQRNGT
jgi:hypothetical protein